MAPKKNAPENTTFSTTREVVERYRAGEYADAKAFEDALREAINHDFDVFYGDVDSTTLRKLHAREYRASINYLNSCSKSGAVGVPISYSNTDSDTVKTELGEHYPEACASEDIHAGDYYRREKIMLALRRSYGEDVDGITPEEYGDHYDAEADDELLGEVWMRHLVDTLTETIVNEIARKIDEGEDAVS